MEKIKKFGPLFIILAAFLWSLDGFLRQELYSLPSTILVFWEHLLGFILLSPFLLLGFKEIKKLDKGSWGAIFWVVIWGGVLGTTFYTKALSYVSYIPLSVVVLLQKLQPIFAISLAYLILKERLNKKFLLWAALAIIGGYFVTFGFNIPVFSTGNKTILAAILAVGAAFAWGSSTVFGKRALRDLGYKTLSSLRFGLTSVVMFFVVFGTNNQSNFLAATPKQWLYLLAIVFSTGAVALFIYYYGLKLVKASTSTICELAWPISAVMLDFIIRGTVLSLGQWLGAILMLIAIYKVSLMQVKGE